MKFHVQLNLGGDGDFAYASSKVNNNLYAFYAIENIVTSAPTPLNYDKLVIEWNNNEERYDFKIYNNNTLIGTYYGYDAVQALGGVIVFDCEPSSTFFEDAVKLEDEWYIDMGGHDLTGITNILTYRLNDERDAISKKLLIIGSITGHFKIPIGIKNIDLDLDNYGLGEFNYVYIPRLRRYYYVSNIQMISNEFTRLILQEDVLMSWKTLIGQQEAFITRYGGASDFNLIDDRFPLKDIPTVEYNSITNYTGSDRSDIIEFKYLMGEVSGQTTKKPNIFMSTVGDITEILPDDTNNIEAPTNSHLPDIQSRRGGINHNYLINVQDYNFIVNACIGNDAPASYIRSILLLPFDLTDIFTDASRSHNIYAGTKQVLFTGWGDPTSDPAPETWETKMGACPYIVVADFYFNANGGINITNTYLDNSPNTQWEIYLPFVGWVQIDPRTLYNDRIMVYYTFDFDTGMSTAYIYNRTKQKTVWSGSCQIGMRLAIATTNADELARQKQATGLNLLMGLMTSALSIGVGAYSGNAVAVMGGIMGMGKTVTGAVNSFNSMIQRAQISYGSSDNALYSSNKVVVRKTTHDQVLTTPDQITRYIKINGYPYRDYKLISDLTANKYIEVGEIHFDAKGENIYSTEIDEIVALLKGGVIL